jgi:hypothetical protein
MCRPFRSGRWISQKLALSIAVNTWVTITGGVLSATTHSDAVTDFNGLKLAIAIDGVTAKGEAAAVSKRCGTSTNHSHVRNHRRACH